MDGHIIQNSRFFNDMVKTETYEYDAEGKLTEEYSDEDGDGTIDSHQYFIYTGGRLTKVDSYDGSGNKEGYALAFYNTDGQVSRIEQYNTFDQLQGYGIFTYETDGRLTQENGYDSDSNLLETYYYTCRKIKSPPNAPNDFIDQLIFK